MGKQPPRNHKSLSERLRSHLAPPRTDALSEQEQSKVQAIAEEIEQRQFSTIAQVMSEGSSPGGPRSRGSAVVHRILEQVEEHPGCDIHQLAQDLGEKSIVILSHVDDLVREGVLLRLEDGRVYRSRDILPVEGEPDPAPGRTSDEGREALERVEQTRIYLRVFRFLTSELGLEPECNRKMVVQSESGKFFEMRGMRSSVNISLYGMFPKELVERFKRESDFDRSRINYSRLTGIVDIRGCRYRDLELVLPWVAEFHKTQ